MRFLISRSEITSEREESFGNGNRNGTHPHWWCDLIQQHKSVQPFDRVAVLCLMISSLGGPHVVDHPVGELPSKRGIEAGVLL